MELFLNFGFAWLAMGLAVILSIIHMTRKMIKNASNNKAWIKLSLKLRRVYKEIGSMDDDPSYPYRGLCLVFGLEFDRGRSF